LQIPTDIIKVVKKLWCLFYGYFCGLIRCGGRVGAHRGRQLSEILPMGEKSPMTLARGT